MLGDRARYPPDPPMSLQNPGSLHSKIIRTDKDVAQFLYPFIRQWTFRISNVLISFSLVTYSEIKITESYDSSVFRETSKLYSIKPMAMFLPRNARGSFFSTSFTALVIFCLFDNSRSNKSESIPHYGFHLRFPDDQ